MAKLRQDPPHLKLMVTEESLSSNAPHLRTLHDHHLHDILGVKEGDYPYLFEHVAAAERAGRVTYDERDDAETGLRPRFRFVRDLPLNEAHPDGHLLDQVRCRLGHASAGTGGTKAALFAAPLRLCKDA